MPCVTVLWGFRDKKTLVDAGAECFCDDARRLAEVVEAAACEACSITFKEELDKLVAVIEKEILSRARS